jgi:MFS family permease
MIPFICLFFVAPVAGALSDRFGSRGLCTLGMAVMTTALFFLSRLAAAEPPLGIAWPLALAGIGMGMFVSPNSSAAMGSVAARHRGIASGTVATARNLGMVLGVAVAGLIFHAVFFRLSGSSFTVYRTDMQPEFMAAFRAAMTGGVACGALGTVISYCRGREAIR